MSIKYDGRNKICIQLQLFPSNEHLTSVNNVQQLDIVVQKIVCSIFCRVISQQHCGSGDLRYEVFVIVILHCH